MKKLSVLALALIAASAFASGPSGGPSAPTQVNISGTSTQAASLNDVNVSNKVEGRDNIGQQNLASNAGSINISGTSEQTVSARGGSISNKVDGNDNIASQNLASNVGNVNISKMSKQTVTTDRANISNEVRGNNNMGVQNIASNNSCATCLTASGHGGDR